MSTILSAAGATIFLVLGLGHALFSLQSKPDRGPLMPTRPEVRSAMSVQGGLGIAPEIESTLYRAWIGFNLSHALGVIAIAGIVLANVLDDFADAVSRPWFLAVVFVAPAIYLVLAQKYWFDKPRDGIAVGAVLLWAGTVIELL